jgi:hypothetical protein
MNIQKDIFDFSGRRYICGYCNAHAAPNDGFTVSTSAKGTIDGFIIVICPNCNKPTFIENDNQTPNIRMGNDVQGIPDENVLKLYNEARDATSLNAYTASVMICRKLLMHIAVVQGANEGGNFVSYVNYLETNNFIPPNSRAWVDEIRKKGNEANHEIILMTKQDAEHLLSFVEMLLKFLYEFPARLTSTP